MLYFCYLGSDFWSSKENLFFFPLYLTERRVLCVNVCKYIHMTPSCNTTLNIFILLYTGTKVCNVQGVGVFLWERKELATQQWIDTLNSYLHLCFQIFQVFQKTWNLTSQEKVPKPQVNSEWIFPYEWGLVYVSLWYISRWNITLYISSLSGVFLPSLPLLYSHLSLK